MAIRHYRNDYSGAYYLGGEMNEVNVNETCHICGEITDITCDRCGQSVCFDHCTKMTIHNQIDYPLCVYCNEVQQIMKADYYAEKEEREEKIKKEKERKSKIRRDVYWKPENIEKRRLAKIERKRLAREQAIKRMAEIITFINPFFR